MTGGVPRLFLVTSTEVVEAPGFMERAGAALAAGGASCGLQLRAHTLGSAALWELARDLRRVSRDAGASLWINDRVDIAAVVRADGVQLGSRSVGTEAARRTLGHSCLVGRSVHTADEALSVSGDFAVLGNVYATRSHREREPLGLEPLRRATSGRRPIVAIGGITPQRVAEIMRCGAWGIAVLSGIWAATDPDSSVLEYVSALEAAVGAAAVGPGAR